MKWFFILLLVANVSYLGWEIDRSTKLDVANQREASKASARPRNTRSGLCSLC